MARAANAGTSTAVHQRPKNPLERARGASAAALRRLHDVSLLSGRVPPSASARNLLISRCFTAADGADCRRWRGARSAMRPRASASFSRALAAAGDVRFDGLLFFAFECAEGVEIEIFFASWMAVHAVHIPDATEDAAFASRFRPPSAGAFSRCRADRRYERRSPVREPLEKGELNGGALLGGKSFQARPSRGPEAAAAKPLTRD